MDYLKKAFWDVRENRLHAGWRILLQFIVNIALILLLGTIVSSIYQSILPADLRGYILAYPVMFLSTILAVWLSGRYLDKRRFSDFGLTLSKKEWWMDFFFGVLFSILSIIVLLFVLKSLGWISITGVFKSKMTGWTIAFPLLITLITHICVGAFEEIARIYQIRNLMESLWKRSGRFGTILAALGVPALISVGMHFADIEYLPPVFLIYVFLDGIFLGLCYLVTGRAAIAIALHFMVDFIALTIFVPNISSFFDGFVTLFSIQFINPVVNEYIVLHLNSIFIIGLLLYELINILALYLWVRFRYGKFSISDNLTVPSLLHVAM